MLLDETTEKSSSYHQQCCRFKSWWCHSHLWAGIQASFSLRKRNCWCSVGGRAGIHSVNHWPLRMSVSVFMWKITLSSECVTLPRCIFINIKISKYFIFRSQSADHKKGFKIKGAGLTCPSQQMWNKASIYTTVTGFNIFSFGSN